MQDAPHHPARVLLEIGDATTTLRQRLDSEM